MNTLNQKANISDISRTLSEVSSSLENKISFDELHNLLRDYSMKSDLQYYASTKVSQDEFRQQLDQKVNCKDLKSELSLVYSKQDDLEHVIQQCRSSSSAISEQQQNL